MDRLLDETKGEYLFDLKPDKYDKRSASLSKIFGNHKVKCGFNKKETKIFRKLREKGNTLPPFKDFHSFKE